MDELKKLTSSIDFNEPYNIQGHRDIYGSVHPPLSPTFAIDHRPPTDHIDALPSRDASSTRLPPSLVFYAARNILSPSFIVGQVPDLLNLLALVETFRRFAVLKSDEALEWQTYYEREKSDGREQDVRLLAANELRTLRGFLNKKDAQRREYVVLVKSLIQLYIHYSWTAPESCLMWKRFNDFFPGAIEGFNKPSELLFHVDLSEEDKACFGRLKVECQEWIHLVEDWADKREETFQEEGVSREDMMASFADDFRDAFPQPCQPSEMARDVEIYMSKVESMVRKLEQWFPPSSRG